MQFRLILPLLLVAAVSSCADSSPEATKAPESPPGPSPERPESPPGPSPDAGDAYQWALTRTPDRRPRVVGETNSQVNKMAMDETHIYWGSVGAGILRVRKTGGPVETFVDTEETYGFGNGIAVDDTAVYWTDSNRNTVNKRSKAGGAIEVLAAEQNRPWGLALDATRVYWTNWGDESMGSPGNNGEIRAIDKKGGTPVTLSSAQQEPTEIAIDDDSVYYSSIGYFPNDAFGGVLRVPKGGGEPELMVSDTGVIRTLAARDGAVYFVASVSTPSGFRGPLVRVSPGRSTILDRAGATGGPGTLALGEDSVFYANINTQTNRAEIRRVAMDGSSSPEILAERQYPLNATTRGPATMSVDAHDIYWVDYWWTYEPQQKGTVFAAPIKP